MCEHFARRGCIRLFGRTSAASFDGGCTEEDQVQGMTSPTIVEDHRPRHTREERSAPGIFFKTVASPEGRFCERAPDPSASYTAPTARTKAVAASTQTEGVQHPRITPVYQNAIPEPGARRGSTPCSTSTDEMIWTRKNTNSVSRLKFFQSTVDDESESKFYIQKKFPTPHHLINRMQITRNISPHGLLKGQLCAQ